MNFPGFSIYLNVHHFRSGTEYAEFAEADMEGRAREGAVRLLDDDDIDRAGERRGVDLVVKEAEIADDLGDIVHAVHVLSSRSTGRGIRPTMDEGWNEKGRDTNLAKVLLEIRGAVKEKRRYSRQSSARRSPACERERTRVAKRRREIIIARRIYPES